MAAKILAFAGSIRAGSWNKKLIRVASQAAREAGAEVTLIDLRDYPLPLYDGDLEDREGLPEPAHRLRELFLSHDALLISSPEYNSSISGVLKNVIDWLSRPQPNQPPLDCFRGKVAGLIAASTGALGGLRGLVHLRAILGNISVLVIPEQKALPKADQAFNDDGSLKDAKTHEAIQNIAQRLVHISENLKV